MDFDAIKKLVLTMLLSYQQDNGPIMTIAAIEALRDASNHTFNALSLVESQVG